MAPSNSFLSVARKEAIMNFYDRWVLPPILDLVMRQHQLQKYRREVVIAASGRVLEVGVGSGLNFPLYGKQVEIVFGIDPSPRLLAIAHRRAATTGVRTALLQGSATAIPFADNTMDTVVMTWTLCSIPDPLAALREMRRVLKPHGKLIFVEHGLSPEPGIERWQHQTHPHLVPYCRRLPSGPEDGRSNTRGRFRYAEASNGICLRATSNDLHVPWIRTNGRMSLRLVGRP